MFFLVFLVASGLTLNLFFQLLILIKNVHICRETLHIPALYHFQNWPF